MEARLASMGLRAREVGGAGDCFFRSVAAQLPALMHNADGFHAFARYYAVHEMRTSPGLYREFAPLRDGETWEMYLARMEQPGEWVEGLELYAVARWFNCTIWVFSHDEAHDERIPPRDINGEEKVDQYTIDINVAHYHDLHYRAIERGS